jgi:hypothetical protein
MTMALRDLGTVEVSEAELEAWWQDEEDIQWWNEHAPELEEKYRGRYIAIVNKEALVGDSYDEAYQQAKAKYPDREPLMDYIPFKKEIWVL